MKFVWLLTITIQCLLPAPITRYKQLGFGTDIELDTYIQGLELSNVIDVQNKCYVSEVEWVLQEKTEEAQ